MILHRSKMVLKEAILLSFLLSLNFQTSLGEDYECLGPGMKLHIFQTKVTFFGAYINCTRHRMEMLEIKSLDQHYKIVDLMAKYGNLTYVFTVFKI